MRADRPSWIALGPCLAAFLAATGCVVGRPGGMLEARSLGPEPVVLRGRFATAYYTDEAGPETTLFFSDVPFDDLVHGRLDHGHVVRLDLLWVPLAGETPVDRSAANVSIRYVVIADGEVGVYAGAGFAWPRGEAGDRSLGLTMVGGSLTLLEHSEGFRDLLSPAEITGEVTALLDQRRTSQMRFAVSQIVTNALNRTRLVEGEGFPVAGCRFPVSRIAHRFASIPTGNWQLATDYFFPPGPLISSILTRR